MDRAQLFRNLMVVAAADGRMSEEEVTFLSLRASRWGLTDADFQAAVVYAGSAEAELVIPPGKKDRAELLRNMVRMMAVDGEISEMERNLFAVAAAQMQLSASDLNDVIDSVLQGN